MSEITLLYCVTKVLMALEMFVEFGAGAPTLTVIGPLVVVTPVRVRLTPPIALVTVLEAELPFTPSTLKSASWPALEDCSDSAPPPSVIETAELAPVAREGQTSWSELVAAAYTVPYWSELIESTKSWIDSPALI